MMMTQQPNEWSSPPQATSPTRYLVLAGASSLVMVLGSLGGFYAASSPPRAEQIEYRSVQLVPHVETSAPAEPVARPRTAQLVPIPAPGGAAAPQPAEPVAAAAPQQVEPAAAPPAAPAEPVAAAAPVAAPSPGGAEAAPAAGEAPAAGAEREPAAKEASAKAHPLLAHEPLPDGSTRGEQEAEAATRRALESRLEQGKATAEELRMLKAICQHQGDEGCKQKVGAALQKISG